MKPPRPSARKKPPDFFPNNLPEPSNFLFVCHEHNEKEIVMGIEQDGQNHGMQGQGMKIDPNWSDAEKERYQGAYAFGKKEGDKKRAEEMK
jgi:hypothetical protein